MSEGLRIGESGGGTKTLPPHSMKESIDALQNVVNRIENGEDLVKPDFLFLTIQAVDSDLKILADEFKPLEYPALLDELEDWLDGFKGDQDRVSLDKPERRLKIRWDTGKRLVDFIENEFSYLELKTVLELLRNRYQIDCNF